MSYRRNPPWRDEIPSGIASARASFRSALVDELYRARALDLEPTTSRMWVLAPPGLRRRFYDGRLSRWDFWSQLVRWQELAA